MNTTTRTQIPAQRHRDAAVLHCVAPRQSYHQSPKLPNSLLKTS
ncbi:Gamma-glutamylhydrolase [Corchorus olitorius]|uniref:Gamma-glutamylhydrolase n=1 Tax=Corchorus olitorius TaxID=93759 RepID=A0A1R3KGT3_9ROSI|nr:Gamma-glutamylhydrolase [Corchorus olitorius]